MSRMVYKTSFMEQQWIKGSLMCGLVNAVCDGADAESAASPEAALQRVKKRVYALSSEVAHLTRERDMLRIQFGQQPGPTLPAGR